MIQRIQTLFLLLSLICTSMFFFFPFAEFIDSTGEISANIDIMGIHFSDGSAAKNISTISVLILILIINLVTFISIFTYKKRMLQMRFSFFNIILQIGSIALIVYCSIQTSKNIEMDLLLGFLVTLPFVAAILTFLAIRAIGKDELLVRSINRIR